MYSIIQRSPGMYKLLLKFVTQLTNVMSYIYSGQNARTTSPNIFTMYKLLLEFVT